MQMQTRWYEIMHPKRAQIKFHLSYSGMGFETTTDYLDGEGHHQPNTVWFRNGVRRRSGITLTMKTKTSMLTSSSEKKSDSSILLLAMIILSMEQN